jgi:hypothetical protein
VRLLQVSQQRPRRRSAEAEANTLGDLRHVLAGEAAAVVIAEINDEAWRLRFRQPAASPCSSVRTSPTFGLARELGPMRIRVNGIAPGPIDTGATQSSVPAVCLFLLSDGASRITGQAWCVDGGTVLGS